MSSFMDSMFWMCLILGEVPGDGTEVALVFTMQYNICLDAQIQM